MDRYVDRVVDKNTHLSLVVLIWAVAAVLLIGCANLVNLLMARATLRAWEIALRMALGARRGRVVRMLLTESLLLSACGAVASIALGFWLLKWVGSLLTPFYFPPEARIAMDGRVLLFPAAATVLTAIAFGLAPAIQASRRDTAESLKEGGRSNSGGRGAPYARHAFVAAQVAVAFVLLVGGGLLIRSFQRLMTVNIGFESEGVVAVGLPLEMEKSPPDGIECQVPLPLPSTNPTPTLAALPRRASRAERQSWAVGSLLGRNVRSAAQTDTRERHLFALHACIPSIVWP